MQAQLTILFFGQLAEAVGTGMETIAHVRDTVQLDELLKARYPRLNGFTYVRSVNNKVVSGITEIPEGATIALLPPFSGG
ncbi:MoaD/ThiS family protein [Flavihumibacter solisilvae]|jgi:molybdopterin converting factor small subunit|uniref:Molybdopterin converting factor n=1 Tax=Flavihumibacter solisilvae TaxID=1349421 RepID=A0A0C1L0X8_9BACT|nr:MoaD/ThiS family protein [Flavihumibacter solisilvae]KIC93672.1 hypothetical protein OI18_16055 [Flavihumibacter solisilvae]